MAPHILERLMAADDPVEWERPAKFDYAGELARVDALRVYLEPLVGHSLELDRGVQDAAFFTELSYRAPPRSSDLGSVILTYVAVRFSKFGRLATIWGNVPEAPISDRNVSELVRALESHGYFYIPADALEEPYRGKNRYASVIRTWWLRFFDYC